MSDADRIRDELISLAGRAGNYPAHCVATADRVVAAIAAAERKRIVALLRAAALRLDEAREASDGPAKARAGGGADALDTFADDLERDAQGRG